MKRLGITLEEFDDSRVVRATTIGDSETAILRSVLSRAKVLFDIEDFEEPLYDYHLETERGEVDLALRTSSEIKSLEAEEPFNDSIDRFLDSKRRVLRINNSYRSLTLTKRITY